MRLSFDEESAANALPAALRQQHALAEVEEVGRVPTMRPKRRLKIIRLVDQGQAGGSTDDPFALTRQDECCARAVHINTR